MTKAAFLLLDSSVQPPAQHLTVLASHKRRWRRFSLRTLFVLVTLFGFWVRWQLQIVQGRKAMLVELKKTSVEVSLAGSAADVPLVRRWLGDRPVAYFAPYERTLYQPALPLPTRGQWEKLKSLFPEAEFAFYSELERFQ